MLKFLSISFIIFSISEVFITSFMFKNSTTNYFDNRYFNENSFLDYFSRQFKSLNFFSNSSKFTTESRSSSAINAINLFPNINETIENKSKCTDCRGYLKQKKILKRDEEALEKALQEVASSDANKTDDHDLNDTILHPIYNSERFRLLNSDEILTNYGFFQVLKTSSKGVRTWHTLCGNNWTTFSYTLACRALGFQKGKKVTTMMGFLGYNEDFVDYTGIRCQVLHDRFDNCFDEMGSSESCSGNKFLPAYLHCLSWSHKNVAWLIGYFDGVHRIAYYFSFERKAYMIGSKVGWNQLTTDLFCRQKKRTSGTFVQKKLEKMRLVYVVECSNSNRSSISLEKCLFSTMYSNEVVAVNCYHNFVHDLMEEGKDVIIRQMAVGIINVTMATNNIIAYVLVNDFKNIDFDCEELVLVQDNYTDVSGMNLLDLTIVKMNFTVGHKQSRSLRYTNSCMNNKSESFSFLNFTYYHYRMTVKYSLFSDKFIMTIVIPAAAGGVTLILIIAITVGVVVKRSKKKQKKVEVKFEVSKIISETESKFTRKTSSSHERQSVPNLTEAPSVIIPPSEDD